MITDPNPQPSPAVMTEAELLALDAEYQPLGEFGPWATADPDPTTFSAAAAPLDALRQAADSDDFARVRTGVMRAAAFDTGVLEGLYEEDAGFTLTAMQMASTFEALLQDKGNDVEQLFAGHLQGYELALDVATKAHPLTQKLIREIHEVTTAGQQVYTVYTEVGQQQVKLPRGAYKTNRNHVREASGRLHAYAPVDLVEPEMQKIVEATRSAEFEDAHPAAQAAYVHHSITAVHPFADGNGRVARAVASIYYFRSISLPLVIFGGQRQGYLASIRAADRGDVQRFVEYIAHRGTDLMEIVTNRMRSGSRDSKRWVAEPVDDEAVTQEQVAGAMGALLDRAVPRLTESALPEGLAISVGRVQGATFQLTPGYTQPHQPPFIQVRLTASHPARADYMFNIALAIASGRNAVPGYLMCIETRAQLPLHYEDITLEPSDAIVARLDAWLDAVLDDSLERLRGMAQANFEATRVR